MRKASLWAVITLFLMLMDVRSAMTQDPVAQLAQRVALSIVKIVVKGTTASGRDETFEGSGLVIGSGPQFSVVLTAAHVIRKREFWKAKDDGEPLRRITIWFRRTPASQLEPMALPPAIGEVTSKADFAILMVLGSLPALPMGNPLQLQQGAPVVALGAPLGKFTIDAPLVGRGQLEINQSFGLVLRLSQIQTVEGHSGGPVLDMDGRVLGIVSGELRRVTGQTLAVPISETLTDLAKYRAESAPNNDQTLSVDGSVQIELQGTGGGDFGRVLRGTASLNTVGVGNEIAMLARGSERSDCKEDSGRRVSFAQGSGSILHAGDDIVLINFDLHAHGGHFRVWGECALTQPGNPTRHDTTARALAKLHTTFRVPIRNDRYRAVRVVYTDVPGTDSVIEVIDPTGQNVASIRGRASGDEEFPIERQGDFTVRLLALAEAKAEGGFGQHSLRLNTRLRAIRVPR